MDPYTLDSPKETFAQLILDGSLNTEPLKIQDAGKRKPELWAHLP